MQGQFLLPLLKRKAFFYGWIRVPIFSKAIPLYATELSCFQWSRNTPWNFKIQVIDNHRYRKSWPDNLDGWCYRPNRAAIINCFNYQRYVLQLKKCITAEIWNTLKHKRNAKPTLIGAVDGGTGTIGSHVAKLILYTSLSLVCISNRNQRCLRKNFLHNGFSDYFLFCTKRGTFINEQRSDRSRPIMWTFKKRKKECTLYEYLKKKKIPQKTDLEYTVQFLAWC